VQNRRQHTIDLNQNVRQFLDELFETNALNRLPDRYGAGRIFDTPAFGVAKGDDPIFLKFKEVVGPGHLTPAQMWVQSGLPDTQGLAARLRIVSIIFPYVDRIREESKTAEEMPAEIYCVGRNFANAFMDEVLEKAVAYFQERGFRATSGMRSPAFQIIVDEEPLKIYSTWSERHMAFAAGLGTFSLHEGFISEIGCNIRITSVITDAPLAVTERKSDDPRANCLFYATGKCQKCARRCPGDAITQEGHDKLKCYLYGQMIQEEMTARLKDLLKPHLRHINGEEQWSYPVGCAFCQFDVPCMEQNPLKRKS
jgi:epoxyqueuosine reductase QueG